MICLISLKQTTRNFENVPVSKEVLDFARWYRDKLNVQQKQKRSKLVNLRSCLNTFIEMRKQKYSWNKIKETLSDELLLKGLITDEELIAKTN